MKDFFSLQDKRIVVIGAGGTIGSGLAATVAACGAKVIAVGRNEKKMEATLNLPSDQVTYLSCDLSDIKQIEKLFLQIEKQFQGIDVLINAAGTQVRKPALEINPDEWDYINNINVRAVFFACKYAAQNMIKYQKKGSIINITSLTAEIGINHLTAYAAGKGAVKQLTKNLAIEWAQYNIRVNAIGPGRILSNMTDEIYASDSIQKDFLRVIPMARSGIVQDLSGAAVLLASESSSYMTGQTIYIDGGWLAGGGNIKK